MVHLTESMFSHQDACQALQVLLLDNQCLTEKTKQDVHK